MIAIATCTAKPFPKLSQSKCVDRCVPHLKIETVSHRQNNRMVSFDNRSTMYILWSNIIIHGCGLALYVNICAKIRCVGRGCNMVARANPAFCRYPSRGFCQARYPRRFPTSGQDHNSPCSTLVACGRLNKDKRPGVVQRYASFCGRHPASTGHVGVLANLNHTQVSFLSTEYESG